MIEVHDLTKRYGPATAVDHLTFDVRPGRVTGFVGPNGAGKSTTLRMILGLATPTAGRALVAGRPYRSLRTPLRTVGSLLDAAAVHGGRRARDHLAWIAATNDISSQRVHAVLDLTGLTGVAGKRVAAFSLGMKQRLGIAVALLGDPPVLVLDEPVNGLDPEGIAWLRDFLRSMAADGRTVLVSSHLIGELALSADHLIVIGHGRLVADADIDDLIAADGRDDAVVRAPHGAGPAELLRRRATLEQVYLALTDRAVEYRSAAPDPLSDPRAGRRKA